MTSIFCCDDIQPYRPRKLDHETKFASFTDWARYPRSAPGQLEHQDHETQATATSAQQKWPYAIQVVRQINYGALESKRYFIPHYAVANDTENYAEITETDILDANFEKVNSYKNFKCSTHNKFFELNLYQKTPLNSHHWRVDVARPSDEIDLKRSRVAGTNVLTTQNQAFNNQSSASVSASASASVSTSMPGKEDAETRREPETEIPESALGLSALSSALGEVLENSSGMGRCDDDDDDGDDDDNDDYDDYDGGYHGRGYGYEDEDDASKDLTACDKECGYCGRCDY